MSTPTTAREARLSRRFDELTSRSGTGDPQLVAAQPDPTVTAAMQVPVRCLPTSSASR